jgi:hypothetical protein
MEGSTDSSPHTIVTLNDKKFVYREQAAPEEPPLSLYPVFKEKVDPD